MSSTVSRAEAMLGRDPGRLVVCHLGAGASLAAVRAGRSVDTTMGFTPLEGLVMATRAGTVDPGMMLWLQEHVGIPTRELADALERRSGLTALGGTPDMRVVLDRAEAGDEPARLALDVYLHRLRQGIAAMAATLGGLDTLVFTGGVGENAARIRADAAAGLAFLGVDLDATRNDALAHAAEPDADVSAAGVRVRVLVIAARDDLQIAAEVRRVLGAASAPDG